jgi:hypothetical protein
MELSATRQAASCEATRQFPAFYGIRRFSTEFTRALHLSLSWTRPIQCTSPHLTSTRSILIFFNYLRIGIPSGLLPSGSPNNNLHAFLFSPIRATCPAHPILLPSIILIILGEEYKAWSSLLCSFLHHIYIYIYIFTTELSSTRLILSNTVNNRLHKTLIWLLFCMGVKIGLWHWGRNIDWGVWKQGA